MYKNFLKSVKVFVLVGIVSFSIVLNRYIVERDSVKSGEVRGVGVSIVAQVDRDYPTVSVSHNGLFSSRVGTFVIQGVARDASSGVVGVEYVISESSGDGGLIDLTGWVGCGAVDGDFGDNEEYYNCYVSGLADGSYVFFARSYDKGGNYTLDSMYAQIPVLVDSNSPDGVFVIDDGSGVTTSRTVTLSIEVNDLSGLVGVQFVVSEDPNFKDVEWETFVGKRAFVLSQGDGVKVIYVRFRDGLGNVSSIISSSIVLEELVVESNGGTGGDSEGESSGETGGESEGGASGEDLDFTEFIDSGGSGQSPIGVSVVVSGVDNFVWFCGLSVVFALSLWFVKAVFSRRKV